MTTTLERLTRILVDKYKVDPARLTLDEPLAGLGIDSLGMVELLFMIEDEFAVKLPSDAETPPTLGAAVQYVDRLLAAQPPTTAALPQQPA
ncbi:MAG TPA: acyl carrier protein [Steroidobacteraceae bacterium]|nr:acyl carrier protein [Steroidobacteraceae bacterium]